MKLFPFRWFAGFLVCFILTPLFAAEEKPSFAPTRTQLPPAGIESKCPLTGGQLFILDLNGSGFIIDTGASGFVMSHSWAVKMKFPLDNAKGSKFNDGYGGSSPMQVVRVDFLTVGGIRFEDLAMMILPNNPFADVIDKSVEGLLGCGLFHGCVLTLDYPRERIRFDQTPLPGANDRDVLPLQFGPTGLPHLPISVSGQKVWALLDSGSVNTVISIPDNLAEGLHFSEQPKQIGIGKTTVGRSVQRVGRLDGDLRLGQYTVHNPLVNVGSDEVLVGAYLLSFFSISIDQQNRVIRFARDGTSPITIPSKSGVGFSFEIGQPNAAVEAVIAGSEAARLGVRVGDQIVSINQKPPENFRFAQWEQLKKISWPIALELERGSEHIQVTVPFEVLVP